MTGKLKAVLWASTFVVAGSSVVQGNATDASPNLNFHGVPGLIDMPSGEAMPDGQLSTTLSYFGGITRSTLTFQLTPRMSGSFRFSATQDWPNGSLDTYYDRSFDFRYLLLKEMGWRPSVTVGFQDFIGTGIHSAEYIVATKHIGDRLRVTGGIGWGRLGSYNSFSNPFGLDNRPDSFTPTGGTFNLDRLFHGPAAFFGGVEWQASDRLSIFAEYSSDAYDEEVSRGIIDRRSPFNFGLNYRVSDKVSLGAYYLYGSEVGVQLTFGINPRYPGNGDGSEPAPLPVHPYGRAAALTWPDSSAPNAEVQTAIADGTRQLFEATGLDLESLAVDGRVATVRFRNPTYNNPSQALGRAARALTYAMPQGVTHFRLVPVHEGVPMAAVTMDRRALENAEHAPDGGADLINRLTFSDALMGAPDRDLFAGATYPRFDFDITPYIQTSLFGAGNPVLADVGVELSGYLELAPGLSARGAIRKRVAGNLDNTVVVSDSVLPHVRTDARHYNEIGDPEIHHLTLDYIFRPARNLYGRVSVGYLEPMFGGISTELLWKPVQSRFALGAEVNYVRQRDFEQLFGFQDYDVVTGHVSGYYAFGNGFHAQLDVGRYLAGDWGATFSLNREFANGWRVGAFVTQTDVSHADFGEGSFDKGIVLTIPMSSVTGRPTRSATPITLRPIQRDGGARLDVSNRLYEQVREYHQPSVAQTWGHVLR